MNTAACDHRRAAPGLDGWFCPDCDRTLLHAPPVSASKPKPDHYDPFPLFPVSASKHSRRAMKRLRAAIARSRINAEPFTCGNTAWATVHEYCSHGIYYYRFAWGVGDRIDGYRHIPGGNIQAPLAQGRAAQVRAAIATGRSPVEVVDLIKGWSRRKR